MKSSISLIAQLVKNLPAMQEILSQDDPLEKGKATHSSFLVWRIPWIVQSMGSQRVGHDWVTHFHFSFLLGLQWLLLESWPDPFPILSLKPYHQTIAELPLSSFCPSYTPHSSCFLLLEASPDYSASNVFSFLWTTWLLFTHFSYCFVLQLFVSISLLLGDLEFCGWWYDITFFFHCRSVGHWLTCIGLATKFTWVFHKMLGKTNSQCLWKLLLSNPVNEKIIGFPFASF